MSTLPASTDVVIVGAGPTGLTLACVLAARRIPFVIVDRLGESANTSRAAVVHARTLEVLEELQVADRLVARGHIVPRFTLRDRDQVLATIHFENLPTRYPYTLMLPQQITEAVLLQRLRELGNDVFRPLMLNDLRQDNDSAMVSVSADGKEPVAVRARYVVGADGMHSTVRERAHIGFSGDKYEQSFVLADLHMDWSLSREEVMLFFSPEGLVVVAPLPGGSFRMVATADQAPENPTMNDVQQLLTARGPGHGSVRVQDVIWSSRFRVHHRIADHYRAGRILVAGDAAHVHSPAGGQGMNTGIQDAVALGHTLAAILGGRADETELDVYERTRRPVAQRVVAFTDRMTKAATLRGHALRTVRNMVLSTVGHVPPVTRRLATELAGLRNREPGYSGSPVH